MLDIGSDVVKITSYTFWNNNSSCSLRLDERIYIPIHWSVFYLLELAVMINLHKLFTNGAKLSATLWNLMYICRPLQEHY